MNKRHFLNIPINPRIRKALKILASQKDITLREYVQVTLENQVSSQWDKNPHLNAIHRIKGVGGK